MSEWPGKGGEGRAGQVRKAWQIMARCVRIHPVWAVGRVWGRVGVEWMGDWEAVSLER